MRAASLFRLNHEGSHPCSNHIVGECGLAVFGDVFLDLYVIVSPSEHLEEDTVNNLQSRLGLVRFLQERVLVAGEDFLSGIHDERFPHGSIKRRKGLPRLVRCNPISLDGIAFPGCTMIRL